MIKILLFSGRNVWLHRRDILLLAKSSLCDFLRSLKEDIEEFLRIRSFTNYGMDISIKKFKRYRCEGWNNVMVEGTVSAMQMKDGFTVVTERYSVYRAYREELCRRSSSQSLDSSM